MFSERSVSTQPVSCGRRAILVNRVYPPQVGATGTLLAELARGLRLAGWQVDVVHVGPRSSPGFSGETVHGVAGVKQGGKSQMIRAFKYAFAFPALLWRIMRLPRADVVVLVTDPPLLVSLAPILLWRHGAVVNWAQDLFPEVAQAVGFRVLGGPIGAVLRLVSTVGLRACDRVVAIGDCMRDHLMRYRRLAPARVEVIRNWAQLRVGAVGPEQGEAFRLKEGWKDRFVVMYAGNFGFASDFTALIVAAREFHQSHPHVHFVLVGSGSQQPKLEALAKAEGWTNVQFMARQPDSELPALLAAADVHLVSLRMELAGLVVPSKIYNVLAIGRPVCFLGPAESEVGRLIRRTGCGVVLALEDGPGLTKTLAGWADSPAILRAAGEAAVMAGIEAAGSNPLAQWVGLMERVAANQSGSSQPSPAVSVSVPTRRRAPNLKASVPMGGAIENSKPRVR